VAKTPEEIISGAENLITGKQPNADFSTGTVNRDIGLEGFAQELSNLSVEIDNTKLLQTLDNASAIDPDDLDSVAANFNLARIAATAASGTITFGTNTQPTSTIQIGAGSGSGGITVATAKNESGQQVSYITTSTVFLTPSSLQNPLTGLYEVDAPAVALIAGTSSNVGANTLTSATSFPAGVDNITNKLAITNGTDVEINTELANRIKLKIQGQVLGTKAGLESLAASVSGVEDTLVIDPNNSLAVRGPGSVDIFILGSSPTTVSDTITRVTGEDVKVLQNQPALSISSITGTLSASPGHVFVEGVDYQLNKDTTSSLKNSVQAQDSIEWLGAGDKPDNGTDYIVTYSREGLVRSVQDEFDKEINKIITADILIKESVQVVATIDFTITVISGSNLSQAQIDTTTAASVFINALGLGEPLQRSDLNFAVRTAVPSIDNLTFNVFSTTSTGVGDLTAAANEYFRVTGASLIVRTS
jgi:uncharacterized phage protein gp47/JayE